jgi:hypothetical protein
MERPLLAQSGRSAEAHKLTFMREDRYYQLVGIYRGLVSSDSSSGKALKRGEASL